MKRISLCFLALLFLFSCSKDRPTALNDLRQLLQDDLDAIAAEMAKKDPACVLERPFYRVLEHVEHPDGQIYSHKVVVDYFYLKTIQMKQIRKYRYKVAASKWERYWKEMKFNLEGPR